MDDWFESGTQLWREHPSDQYKLPVLLADVASTPPLTRVLVRVANNMTLRIKELISPIGSYLTV